MTLLICYGLPKSASSFVCQLAREIVQVQSNQDRLFLKLPSALQDDFFQDDLESKVDRFNAAIPDESIYVIKTHDPLTPKLKNLLKTGRAKAIASYRNPYDIAVSLKDAGSKERQLSPELQRSFFVNIRSHEDALAQIPYHLKCARSWLQFAHDENNRAGAVLPLSFDQIVSDPYGVAEAIAAHIGITTDVAAIVSPYLADKRTILEFNVGKAGRGERELDRDKILAHIKQSMDNFVNDFLPDSEG